MVFGMLLLITVANIITPTICHRSLGALQNIIFNPPMNPTELVLLSHFTDKENKSWRGCDLLWVT